MKQAMKYYVRYTSMALSSEAHREECENRLENVLTKGNEKVIAKIVEISLKSYSRPELCTYSKKYLERYASDSQGSVADSYCWYCSSLPIEAFDFYCSIASSWAGKQYREIHHECLFRPIVGHRFR